MPNRILLAMMTAPALWALDLTRAVVVQDPSAPAREKKAVTMLVEEVTRRSQVKWRLSGVADRLSITVKNRRTGPNEGYSITAGAGGVSIEGNDERGVLFGVGRLLRQLRFERGRVEVDGQWQVSEAPKYALRGHQLGYRPKTNSYDGWTLAMWEQYYRDLIVWGTNAIELIPPRSDDAADSPHFPLPPMEMMIGMSRLADEYGLDLWIWYPALDKDYSDPTTVEFALAEWANVFQKLPRIDAIFVPGGDPGHTHPKFLMPMLARQTASLKKFHPKAQMWIAPQGFTEEWMEEFYRIVRQEPPWLHGIVHGPQVRVSMAELRQAIPNRFPLRNYPDITHTLRSQYVVPDWDHAFAATLNREPVNPRPVDQAIIFRRWQPYTVGFIAYSEGCNDDVNKVIWSALGWNPDADVTDILRQYSRYFIGGNMEEGFAQGLLALERNWRGPLLMNEGVYRTLAQFEAMDRQASPDQLLNWRFQQAQYRAHYDSYQRRRLIHETALEERAMDRLRAAGATGSLRAMREADAILAAGGVGQGWRARTFELAEALFQSIRMQLSVPWYKAIAVGRGANLDLIDTPLNNRLWLADQFERIRTIAAEAARLEELKKIVHWSDPGPGGFYDDLGNPQQQPHLVQVKSYSEDPARLVSPLTGFMAGAPGSASERWRISWQTHAEALNDATLRMEYSGLDTQAAYLIRLTYGGEDVPSRVRLTAGQYEIHGWMRKPFPLKQVAFAVPRAATAGGRLSLQWEKERGAGGAGRGLQISEVWLERVPE